MSISAALAEAYASGDEDGVVLTAAEINHPSFPAPIRVVAGVDTDAGDPADTVSLPVAEGGAGQAHTPCAFSLVRPGADRDGPTDGKVSIDNVSDLLHPYLKGAVGYVAPFTVTFREYRVEPGPDALSGLTGPDEEIAGLELHTVDLTAAAATGTLAWPDGRDLNVPTGPNAFFDRVNYAALFS